MLRYVLKFLRKGKNIIPETDTCQCSTARRQLTDFVLTKLQDNHSKALTSQMTTMEIQSTFQNRMQH